MEDQDKYVSTLNAQLLAKAEELWGEDEVLRNETLQIIRDWISQQPHFTCRTGNNIRDDISIKFVFFRTFFWLIRCALLAVVCSRLQVQLGEDETQTGNVSDNQGLSS
jgi:hypothetical protein